MVAWCKIKLQIISSVYFHCHKTESDATIVSLFPILSCLPGWTSCKPVTSFCMYASIQFHISSTITSLIAHYINHAIVLVKLAVSWMVSCHRTIPHITGNANSPLIQTNKLLGYMKCVYKTASFSYKGPVYWMGKFLIHWMTVLK